MDFMDTVPTEDMPVPASDAEAVHPLVVAAPPAQTPAPAACPALSKAKQGLPVPMKTPPPRAGDAKLKHHQSFGPSKVPLHRLAHRRSPLWTRPNPLLRRRPSRRSSLRRKRGLPPWCRRRPKSRKSPPCRLPQLRQLSRRRLRPLFPRQRAKLATRLRHPSHPLRANLASPRWIVRPAWQLQPRLAELGVSSMMRMVTRFSA